MAEKYGICEQRDKLKYLDMEKRIVIAEYNAKQGGVKS